MKVLGLRLNAKKSVLSPLQRTTYLGVVWDSTTMQARLSPARIESILAAVRRVREGQSLTVKQFQRLLGLMAAASNVMPIGLLYMRPLQWWLKTKGFSPRGNPLRMIKVTRHCLRALDMWRQPWFLSQGPLLGAPYRHVRERRTHPSPVGPRSVERSSRLAHQQARDAGRVSGSEILSPRPKRSPGVSRTDNTPVVSYINHQGGLRSRHLYRLAHQVLVWAQGKLLSLRAVYIPGHLNVGADTLSRQGPLSGEWMLHTEVVKPIWRVFGQAQVDLFATQETAQCPLWYSLLHPAPLGLDAMVQTGPRLRLYAFPPVALLPGVLERVRRDGVRLLLVAPFWPGRVWFSIWFPSSTALLGRFQSGGISSHKRGSSPPPGDVEVLGVAPEGAQLVASGLSTEVVGTVLQSRAPSARKTVRLEVGTFTSWCGGCQLDPVNCPFGTVLESCRPVPPQG